MISLAISQYDRNPKKHRTTPFLQVGLFDWYSLLNAVSFLFSLLGLRRRRVPLIRALMYYYCKTVRKNGRLEINFEFLIIITSMAHVVAAALIYLYAVSGCSDFLLNASDDSIVSARTMDYEIDLKTIIEIIPRNTVFEEAPVFNCSDCPNFKWRSKYGYLGFNAEYINYALDGMNEKGLSASWLYLTGTNYPRPDLFDARPIITNLCSYILGNFATAHEVREGIKKIQIAEVDIQLISSLIHLPGLSHLPLHMAVHDASGESLVIEFLNGQTIVHDNPYGVMTNEPSFDWHVINLKINVGSNIVPGGYSSVDRFMRLYQLNQYASALYTPNTTYAKAAADQAVISRAAHVINTVIRPPGVDGSQKHNLYTGSTQWSVIRDHKRLQVYFRSTENQLLRSINMTSIDFRNLTSRQYIPVTYGNWSLDVSTALNHPVHHQKSIDLPPRQFLEHLTHLSISTSTKMPPLLVFTLGMICGIAGMRFKSKRTEKYALIPTREPNILSS